MLIAGETLGNRFHAYTYIRVVSPARKSLYHRPKSYIKNKRITMRTTKSRNCLISRRFIAKDKEGLGCNIEYMSGYIKKMLFFGINYIAWFDCFFVNRKREIKIAKRFNVFQV